MIKNKRRKKHQVLPVVSTLLLCLGLSVGVNIGLKIEKEVFATDLPPLAYPIETEKANLFSVSGGALTHYYGSGGDVVVPSYIGGEKVRSLGGHDSDIYVKDGEDWIYRETIPLGVFAHPVPETNVVGTTGNFSLRGLVLPDTLEEISSYAFAYSTIEHLYLGQNLKTIAPYSFYQCDKLQSVTLPPSMTQLDKNSFYNCWSLKNIYIPPSVLDIDDGFITMDHFSPSHYLTVVGYENTEAFAYAQRVGASFHSLGVYHSNENTSPQFEFEGVGEIMGYKGKGGSVVLPSSLGGEAVTRVGGVFTDIYAQEEGAFLFSYSVGAFSQPLTLKDPSPFYVPDKSEFQNLTRVVLPEPLLSVGGGVNQDPNIPLLGWGSFAQSGLGEIVFGPNLETVEPFGFYGNQLTSLRFPSSLTALGDFSFAQNPTLRQVYFSSEMDYLSPTTFENTGAYFEIYGYENTLVQQYAQSQGLTFISMGEKPVGYQVVLLTKGEGYTSLNEEYPEKDQEVIATPHPADGYGVQWVEVKTMSGALLPVTYSPDKTSFSFVQPSESVTVTVTYTPSHSVTVSKLKNGTVLLQEEEVAEGGLVRFQVLADEGYALSKLTVTNDKKEEIFYGLLGGETAVSPLQDTQGTQGTVYQLIQSDSEIEISASFQKVGRSTFPPQVIYAGAHLESSFPCDIHWSNPDPLFGELVTLTLTAKEGYLLQGVELWDSEGTPLSYWTREMSEQFDAQKQTFHFLQPRNKVSVKVKTQKIESSQQEQLEQWNDLEKSDPITPYALYVTEEKLLSGSDQHLFQGSDLMTRGMVATVLAQLSGELQTPVPVLIKTFETDPLEELPLFLDVEEGQWYYDGVTWCRERKIVSGYENGLFGVHDPVTKEQMISIFYRFAQYVTLNFKGSAFSLEENLHFGEGRFVGTKDVLMVSDYGKNAVVWALGQDYINDPLFLSQQILNPQELATREDFVRFLTLFYQDYGDAIALHRLTLGSLELLSFLGA